MVEMRDMQVRHEVSQFETPTQQRDTIRSAGNCKQQRRRLRTVPFQFRREFFDENVHRTASIVRSGIRENSDERRIAPVGILTNSATRLLNSEAPANEHGGLPSLALQACGF